MNQINPQKPVLIVLQESELREILETSLNSLKAEIKELLESTQTPGSESDLLTSNDLCKLLKTTKSQLWKWTQKGLLNPIRFSDKGKIFYRKSEVLESLKGTRKMRKLDRERGLK